MFFWNSARLGSNELIFLLIKSSSASSSVWWWYWVTRIAAFFLGCIAAWLVAGLMIGDEVRSICWALLVQALAKAHVFVDLDFGLSQFMCCLSASCFALMIVRLFAFFLALHSFLLDSQSILTILGSQQFLAFLASAIAFLQLVLHDICGVYLLIFSLTYLFFIKDHSTLRAGFSESTLDDLVRILVFACSLEATIGDDFIKGGVLGVPVWIV